MKSAAKYVIETLEGLTAFGQLVSNASGSGPFWELAPEDASYPLVTFSLTKQDGGSKDFRGRYELQLRFFVDRQSSNVPLSDAAHIEEVISNELRNNNVRWNPGQVISGYTDDNRQAAFIEANYTFNISSGPIQVVLTGTGSNYSGTIIFDDIENQTPVSFVGDGSSVASLDRGTYSVAFLSNELMYEITTLTVSIVSGQRRVEIGVNYTGGGEEL